MRHIGRIVTNLLCVSRSRTHRETCRGGQATGARGPTAPGTYRSTTSGTVFGRRRRRRTACRLGRPCGTGGAGAASSPGSAPGRIRALAQRVVPDAPSLTCGVGRPPVRPAPTASPAAPQHDQPPGRRADGTPRPRRPPSTGPGVTLRAGLPAPVGAAVRIARCARGHRARGPTAGHRSLTDAPSAPTSGVILRTVMHNFGLCAGAMPRARVPLSLLQCVARTRTVSRPASARSCRQD